MNTLKTGTAKMTNYRWMICAMLFFATTINYLDRQVLSLTWKDFIAPEFHWTNDDYGNITSLFSLFYAISMLFAGRFVDWMDTKKGFLWAIGVWSFGACIHAFCGIATSGITAGEWLVGFEGARNAIATVGDVGMVVSVSVTLFIFARLILAIGEAGNFPAAIKATAEYFPKKDRAYATSIFNAGATVGALAAPISIPVIAKYWGWEMAFILIGALGFVWMGFWVFIYKKPEVHPKVNAAELAYIQQDKNSTDAVEEKIESSQTRKLSFVECFKFRQTWAFAFGKFMTDGVWWFYLFWTPAYLSSVYGMKSSDTGSQVAIFVLYLITLLSIIGGWLPTYFVEKKSMNPYAGRMKAMLIFAFFPLLALFAQPLGSFSYWFPVIIIGIAGAAHQAWSANIFSTVGDMFPKTAIATITGIGGMAGGIGSFIIQKSAGKLFDYAGQTQMSLFNFKGEEAGYFIIFSVCAVAYLIGWVVMKILVPKYSPIIIK
ncbi:ACS family hexuronate transporter-like MFS transporter [Parabacteroides sp. PF5-5]|uniref:MFS transporter n=1 Tax=unclassified Parabacteroides TaxID=2649774 RepID=UPI0024731EB2|nr:MULTISPECIES: MFS transporter [unclassified Parabacteroides]MDH6304337.1 ACS family hexuronate transporter-like MFS transporter [Parabacteroides sp. PH5-39]MDH6315510.1 ACS family hexuronate transporter-like MFS transporter [Parabacteroides sp. PF5-13]MDH6318996.1 ACS family hexuronate transporter-like MFS transporter [Parabacteroides sp. PH5-13]MDH6322725.1 ACS family hexuronate transporter-like MFS transporter [Parabacteroides sp. PH5-8]MDH6326703.1 ACS family hexuronate transporter-like 